MTKAETTQSGEAPRVMLYSQDGFGLGHLRRTSLIAAARQC